MKNKRKTRDKKAKAEAKFAERARAWAEAKAKEKADIARLDDEVRDKSEFEANMRKNANVVNRAAVEAAAKIRDNAKIQGAKIKRAEA